MQIDRLTPEVRELASGLKLPEGPVALPDGSVILVEMRRQTLSRVTAAGQVEVVADLGGGPKGAIQVVDPRTGKVETLYDRCDGQPIGAPNVLVFDEAGGFWFTDFGVYRPGSTDGGGVYYARADCSRIEAKIFPLDHPNGIGLAPDGKRLYVAETPTGRCIAYDLASPGVLAAATGDVLVELEGQMFDSLAVDAHGHICSATLATGAVSDVWPDGSRVDQYLLPDPIVTNVCFGGPDRHTAFATLSLYGRLVAFDWPRAGA